MRPLPFVAVVLLAYSAVTSARGQTFLSGDFPATLTAAQSPYIALSVLRVDEASCTVEAGVTIHFTAGTGIELHTSATLLVLGTAGNPVVMDGYAGATWAGISFPTDTAVRELVIEHCNIEGATRAIQADGGGGFRVRVAHCAIDATSREAGIWLFDSHPFAASQMQVADTHVIGGALGGIYLYATSAGDAINVERAMASDSPSTGITIAGHNATASNLEAYRNEVGIRFGWGSLIRGTFEGNETAIVVGGSASALPVIEDCAIVGNTYGVTVAGAARFTNCAIHDNDVYDVSCVAPILQVTTIDMRGCYWGPTTTEEMVAEGTFSDISTIFDWWDNSQYALVDYVGFIGPVAVTEEGWANIKAAFR